MTPLDILRGARELLRKREAWTKGSCARTATGMPVSSIDEDACCFCIAGAIWRITGTVDLTLPFWLCKLAGFEAPAEFNDDPKTTHADILALLDKGIAQLEGTNV